MNEMNTLKPDIIIISNFTETIVHGNNDRFDYLAKLLSNSCDVELIGSTFKHYIKKQCTDKERQQTRDFPYKYTCISEPGYPTNICLQRFRSHYVWGHNVIRYLKHRKKPDLIYCAVPSLTGPNLVSKYCEKNYVPFIIDIQDLWPEAFQMVFNVPVVSDVAFAPFKALADGIYKRADQIVAVSQTYVDRALKVNHKVKKGYPVFLGTDLKTFDENARNNPIKREDLNEFWIGYCGSMGDSYDLDIVIDAISIVNKSFKSNSDKKDQYKIKFVAMGDGQMRKEFQSYAEEKRVDALFTGMLPYDKMCGFLSRCDIVVNPIAGKSAASIINKHADYAASGLPVLNTQDSAEYRKLVDDYHMGFNCRNHDANDLAEKINLLVNNKGLREEMGANARRCAEEKFDKQVTYKTIEHLIGGGVKHKDEIWIAYCGTLGASYDLTVVIDALALVSDPRITLVVMGDGPRRKEFEDKSKEKGVKTFFTGLLPYPVMCGLLTACDINVNPIMPGAAQSIINKHADYAASGHPVINTQEGMEYRKLVHDYRMGFNCKNNAPEDLAKKIVKLVENDQLCKTVGLNARRCAVERFDRRNTYQTINEIVQNFLNNSGGGYRVLS